MIEIAEFTERWMKLQPQSTVRHSWAVYGFVRSLQPDTVLEIGPFHGAVTALIALALNHNNKGELHAIDNFTHEGSLPGADALRGNIESCGIDTKRVHIITGDSAKVEWPAKIDIAILDGDRTLPNFKYEVKRVMDAGAQCFCVHDIHYHGYCNYFMEQFRKKKAPQWDVIDFSYDVGFAVAMKKLDGPFTGWVPEANSELVRMELP